MLEEATSEKLPEQSGSYFVRHWRGELPLRTSWWRSGVLIGFGVNMAAGIAMIVTAAVFSQAVPVVVLVSLGEIVLLLVWYVWALVGTWRSAGRYQGPRIWKIWARVGMSIGVVLTAAQIFQALIELGKLL